MGLSLFRTGPTVNIHHLSRCESGAQSNVKNPVCFKRKRARNDFPKVYSLTGLDRGV